MQKNQKSRTRNNTQQNIRVILDDGTKATVNRNNIGKMTTFSGTASDGTEVHSLQAKQIGKSTVIRDNRGNVSSFITAELEVLIAGIFNINDLSKVRVTPK